MKFAAALAVAALLVPGADGKGGSAIRGSPTAGRSSGAWRYAAGGFVAGAATYMIGSTLYRQHVRYQERNYDSYYNNRDQEWKNRHPRRSSTNCNFNQGSDYGPRTDMTNAWVIVEYVMKREASNITSQEIEVDLYNELTFKSPCNRPTDVVTLYKCKYTGQPTATASIQQADRTMPERCQLQGDVESLPSQHVDARRRQLLQFSDNQYSIVEVAIGAVNVFEANDLAAAAREVGSDEHSEFNKYYQAKPTTKVEVVDVETASPMGPAALMSVAVMLVSLVL